MAIWRKVGGIVAVGLALFFSSDSAYQTPHGWPHRCAFGEEADALDAITAVGGLVFSIGDEVHVEFPDACLAVRERENFFFRCAFSWRIYKGPPPVGGSASDAEIALLADVPNVVGVNLCGTGVTDRSLQTLEKFPSLRYVELFGTSLSPEAIASFEVARPEVSVGIRDPIGFNTSD